jgi:hypothetical protein
MRRLLTAAALALLTTTALAAKPSKQFTIYKGTYWETFGIASNDDGVPMCGMGTAGENNRFYVKWTPTNGTMVQVWKSNLRLAAGTEVPLKLEFFANDRPGDSADSAMTVW